MAEIAVGRVISGKRDVSSDTIMERAARAASGFAELGVGAGDSIAVVLRNDFPFFEASFGAQLLGAYSVPVNWHGKPAEIGYVLRDCGAKAVVAHADLLAQVAPAVPPGVPDFEGGDGGRSSGGGGPSSYSSGGPVPGPDDDDIPF